MEYATTPTFYEDIDSNFFSVFRVKGHDDIADFAEENLYSNTIELGPLDDSDLITLAKLTAEVAFRTKGKKVPNVLDYGILDMVSFAGVAGECYIEVYRGDWTVFELNFQDYLKVFTSQSIHLIRFVELMADAG